MAKIVLWNSIAKRRRSISDTFYDNGLATLKGYLEEKGHRVDVIDWAQDDFFQALTPLWLACLLRIIYSRMMKTENNFQKKLLGFISLQLQEILSLIQEGRLNFKLWKLARQIAAGGTYIVGIKIWYGEAFTNAKYLVQALRKIAPHIVLIAGGYHVTLYEEYLLEKSAFDLGVVCEGEFALEEVLARMNAWQGAWNKRRFLDELTFRADSGGIDNLIYRKNGTILKTKRREITVHSSKSIPRYSLSPHKVSVHVMVESLGCDWGKCHFCVHPHFYPHYSLRDPEEIVREMEAMEKFGIGVFRFAGSDTPPAFGARIAQKIKERGLRPVFGMGSRPIRGAHEQYESLVAAYTMLIESGLRAIFMGGETGNDLINQEVMNKGVVFDDIVNTIRALREAEKRAGEKVFLSLALIYPAPLLGKVTLERLKDDNLRLLLAAQPDSVMITPPGPFLHTSWYEFRDEFDFTVNRDIITQAMEYEYVLYKPPSLWPKLEISLEGRPFRKLLEECNELRRTVETELHIPTDISDEHFLMFYSAGIREKEEILKIKNDTMLDIVSCDYRLTRTLANRVNTFSQKASLNR